MVPSSSPIILFCSEDASDCLWSQLDEAQEDADVHPASSVAFPVEDHDVQAAITAMIDREVLHMPALPNYSQKLCSELLHSSSRQNAIDWLFKVQSMYSFSPLTAYLSVNYLDRFLSLHELPNGKAWMMQLLSVACLSIAAKMEETGVPLLLDLQVGADYIFEPRTVQRMELHVLSTLGWRTSSVTPFSYTDYFVRRLGNGTDCDWRLHSRVKELILCAIQELEFLEFRPSVVAAGAALCGIRELMTESFHRGKKSILSMLPSQLHVSVENCSQLMMEHHSLSSCESSVPPSPAGVLDASFSSSSDSDDHDPSTIIIIVNKPPVSSSDASICSTPSSPPSKKIKLADCHTHIDERA